MCSICGCAVARHDSADPSQARGPDDGNGAARDHAHDHHAGHPHRHNGADAHDHDHDHDGHHHHHHHGPDDGHGHGHLHGHPPAAAVRPQPGGRADHDPDARRISVEIDILAENNRFAAGNRAAFARCGITALNLMSGPGSGKTTLLVRTVGDLLGRRPVAVIEGDQETCFDADRIRAAGDLPVVQINTGKGCHLDAAMVARALPQLAPPPGALLFIENVGNLVCPAAFDLGEAAKVVLLSVTEGEDKPVKYASMFAAADLLVLTKVDLLPHLPFDLDRCVALARRVNPRIEVLAVSALSGEGMGQWHDWLDRRRTAATSAPAPRHPRPARPEAIR